MNKQAARKRAQEGTLSIGDLRKMIAAVRENGGLSKVNPVIPLSRAAEIYAAALSGRNDAEVPVVWQLDVYSRKGRMQATGDQLLITNILRDCA